MLKTKPELFQTVTYEINQEVWLYRTDIQGFTKGYITGFTKKRISAYNYTLDRVGHYKPEHIKPEEKV